MALREPQVAAASRWARPRRDPWHFDVFDDPYNKLAPQESLFHAAPLDEWLVLMATVLVLAVVDLTFLRRLGGTFRSNLCILAFWIAAGLAYNGYFYLRYGPKASLDWFTGFVLEWMLSIDNLFVFHIIFRFYSMPAELMHKALFFGILGAVLFRMFIFFTLGTLMHVIHWVRFVFGILLIYSGIQAVAEEDEEASDITETFAVRTLRWVLGSRLKENFDLPEQRLFLKDGNGRLCVTLTVYIILCLEVTDIVFAVDSVSAKVAQIFNLYVAYSSSVLAIFGLRAMFFVLKDLVDCFELLKYGICIILVFVGVELIVSPFVHLESATVLIVITSVFTISISASTARSFLASRCSAQSPASSAGDGSGTPPSARAAAVG